MPAGTHTLPPVPARWPFTGIFFRVPCPVLEDKSYSRGSKSREQLGTTYQTTGIQRVRHPHLPFVFGFSRNWLLLQLSLTEQQSSQCFPLAHLATFSVALAQLSKGEMQALSPRAQDGWLLQGCSACGWRRSSGRVLLTHIRRLSDGMFQGQTRAASPHLRY